ncbi:TPA: hypothetical protein HA246_05230 [Candidatus Woesearchaeota archaeon]|nr:hypothetical protein [Candidatus Woesearchaeota archaeon]
MATCKRFSKRLKSGFLTLDEVVKLILALVISVSLLVLIWQGIGWFMPEKVSTVEVKNLAIEITQLRDEIDNTNWEPGDNKIVSITLPVQLKQGLTLVTYTYSKDLPPPSEKCKEVSCLDLKKGGATVYVHPLPKSIVFAKNEIILHGDNKITNLKIDLVRDDSKNQYVASIQQISEQQPIPQTQEPAPDPAQIT